MVELQGDGPGGERDLKFGECTEAPPPKTRSLTLLLLYITRSYRETPLGSYSIIIIMSGGVRTAEAHAVLSLCNSCLCYGRSVGSWPAGVVIPRVRQTYGGITAFRARYVIRILCP